MLFSPSVLPEAFSAAKFKGYSIQNCLLVTMNWYHNHDSKSIINYNLWGKEINCKPLKQQILGKKVGGCPIFLLEDFA